MIVILVLIIVAILILLIILLGKGGPEERGSQNTDSLVENQFCPRSPPPPQALDVDVLRFEIANSEPPSLGPSFPSSISSSISISIIISTSTFYHYGVLVLLVVVVEYMRCHCCGLCLDAEGSRV